MNFNNFIDELVIEIKDEIRKTQVKKESVLDEWNKFAFETPNQTKKLKELESKLENANSEEEIMALSKEMLEIREQSVKYNLGEIEKQRKIDELYDERQYNIMVLIKKKIIKIKKNIDLVNNQFDNYAKNIYNANDSVIDLRTLSADFRNFDKLTIAMEVLNKYDGRVARESVCRELVQGLDESTKKIIVDLYRIIVRFSINMDQDVVIEEDVAEETEVTEYDIIEIIKESVNEVKEEVEAELLEHEGIKEEPKVEEVKKEEVKKEETLEQSEKEFKEEITSEEKEETKVEPEKEEFLSMYNYLSENEPTEDDVLDFIVLFDSLSEVDSNDTRKYEKIIKKYNNIKQLEVTKTLDKEALEHYTGEEIALEFTGMLYKKIMGSKLAHKINKSRLEKAKGIAEDETLDYEIREMYMDKTDDIINSISSNFVISGVRYYINRNRLSNLKYKLYQNDNKMLSAKFERKLKRVSKRVSNIMNKELKKLVEKEALTQESIYLVLDQYLELLSICDRCILYTHNANFHKYLLSLGSPELMEIYLNAANVIIDYRSENNFMPYELRRVHNGVVYSELDEMFNYYDADKEALKNPTRGRYIKNDTKVSKIASKTYKRCCE